MIEGPQDLDFLVRTSFGMLQGCRMRNTKTVSASDAELGRYRGMGCCLPLRALPQPRGSFSKASIKPFSECLHKTSTSYEPTSRLIPYPPPSPQSRPPNLADVGYAVYVSMLLPRLASPNDPSAAAFAYFRHAVDRSSTWSFPATEGLQYCLLNKALL